MKEPTWPVRGLIALLLLSATPSLRAEEASSESRAEEEASGQEAAPPGETTRAGILKNKREQKSQELTPYKVSSWEARLRRWEKAKFPQNWLIKGWHGFRPVFGGMPSGSGTVFGGGYIHGLGAQYFQAQANARFSTKGYTMFDGEAVFPPPPGW